MADSCEETGLSPEAKKVSGSLFALLKKFEREALAFELASMLVGCGAQEEHIRNALGSLKANSEIAKNNRKIKTRNTQLARLKVLAGKKKRSKAEQAEAERLMKALKPFLTK